MTGQNDRDTNEFLRLLLSAQPRIYGYIRAQVSHRPDAEDVLQETVATLWAKFDEFTPGTDFLAWSYATARFKVLHYYRDRKHITGFSEDFLELVADESESMSDELTSMQDALAKCLQSLPSDDREVVQRVYGSELTIRGAAKQLGRPFDTVKSVLKRSRRALYDCIRRTLSREARS